MATERFARSLRAQAVYSDGVLQRGRIDEDELLDDDSTAHRPVWRHIHALKPDPSSQWLVQEDTRPATPTVLGPLSDDAYEDLFTMQPSRQIAMPSLSDAGPGVPVRRAGLLPPPSLPPAKRLAPRPRTVVAQLREPTVDVLPERLLLEPPPAASFDEPMRAAPAFSPTSRYAPPTRPTMTIEEIDYHRMPRMTRRRASIGRGAPRRWNF